MDAKAEVRSVDRSAQLCEAHRQPSSCCCTLPRVSVQTRKAYGSTAGGCPGASIRKEQPLIQSYSHFFSREECTEVIELARAKGFRRAKTRSKTLTSGRTNSSAWLPHDASPALWQLTQRVADCVGLPTFVAEQWQVIHYRAEGREEYRRHYDSYSPDDPGCHENLARSGNRLVTCLGYLNDLPAGGGGETKFVALPSPIAVRPETGKLLIFHNCEGNRSALSFVPPGGRHPPVERDSTIHTDKAVRGDSAYDHCWAYGPQEDLLNVQQDGVKYAAKRHELSEHCGMPVLKGEKYAFNLWFRERPTHGGVAAFFRQNPSYRLPVQSTLSRARDLLSEGCLDEALAMFRRGAVLSGLGEYPADPLARRIAALEEQLAQTSTTLGPSAAGSNGHASDL